MNESNVPTDDVFRGFALGAMLLVCLGAGWLFLVGQLLRAEDPSGWAGAVLVAAGIAGIVTAVIVGQGVVRGAPRRTAVGAIAQAVLAVGILCWWLAADVWDGTRHAGVSGLPLLLVIVLDVALVLWARSRWQTSQSNAPE